MEANKSKIIWGWVTLVAGFGIPMLLQSSVGMFAAILGLILQAVSLILGIILWRSSNPLEKKNGMAITIIWLIVQAWACGIGFMIGLGAS